MITIKALNHNNVINFATRVSEVCMVLIKGGRFLLVTKNDYADPENMFRFPTGGIDKGESDEEALKRELVEEFNQPLKLIKDLGVLKYHFVSSIGEASFYTHCYLVRPQGDINLDEDEEHSDYVWVTLDELPIYEKRLNSIDSSLDLPNFEWSTWGKFRSATLKYVSDCLKDIKI